MTTEWSAISTYESYKDSGVEWIGNIPEHWEIKPLRRISKVHSGNGFPIELQGKEEGTVPFIKVSDFSSSKRYLFTANNHVSEKVITRKNWNKVPKNCLVTAKIGEALRKNHRNLLGCEAIIDNNCIGFEPTGVDLPFFYYLNTIIDFDWFTNTGPVPSISVQKYRSWKVAIPSVEEQQEIAKFLDEKTTQIDQAIEIKQLQITLLKERKQIVIQDAVTKGLDAKAPIKESGIDWIGNIPAHWDVKPLLSEAEVKSITNCADRELLSVYLDLGVVPFSDVDEKRTNPTSSDLSGYQAVDPGDFVLNNQQAWRGSVGVSKHKGIISPAYIVLSLSKRFDVDYANYLLRSPAIVVNYLMASKGVGTIQRNLYWQFLKRMPVFIPPKKEQQEIVSYISERGSKIDLAVSAQQKQIDQLTEYKASLINSAVTGKIKVS